MITAQVHKVAPGPVPQRPIASIEGEQALLGAILVNNDALGFVSDLLKPEDFAEPLHRSIFDITSRQIMEGRKVTPVTLRTALPENDIGDGVTISQYLARLASDATTVINARDYARNIRDMAVARQIAAIGDDLRAAPDRGKGPGESVEDAWRKLEALRAGSAEIEDRSATIGDAAARMLERIREIQAGNATPATSTGLQAYDRAIGGGYRKGRLYVEAGRPGAGKTVKAIASARRIARAGYGVLFFSLEIDEAETAARTVAAELARSSSPIPYRDIVTGQVDDSGASRIAETCEKMRTWPLRFDCSTGLSMAQIEARARLRKEQMARAGVDLAVVIVDYLGLIKVTDRYKGNSTIELGEIALASKEMSKRLDVAAVLLSQLNRGVEGRDDKRPTMADLRQSGNIEEHADCVALCYRPAYYLEKSAKYKGGDPDAIAEMDMIKNNFELIIDKNRLGPTTTALLWCDVALNAVEDKAKY